MAGTDLKKTGSSGNTDRTFADGQLPVAITTLYTATGTMNVEVGYANSNLPAITVNLYLLRVGKTARHIIPLNLVLSGLMTCSDISLSKDDALQGNASVADEIDYTIEGTAA